MRRTLAFLALVIALSAGISAPALAKSRIKDIVEFEGNRTNVLVGTGLVVGLNGTGDNLRNAPQTRQAMEAMMERLGTNIRDANLNSKNVAAVVVTAYLPAFAGAGSKLDVTVSSSGDAKSLLGGTLLVTPLIGADGEAYAAAQGTVQTGSVSASGASGSSITKGVPTAGRIANGGTVEREVPFSMAQMTSQKLTLRNPDFTTATRIASAINDRFPGAAVADNATVVTVRPPNGMKVQAFATAIENLEVEPDSAAKVIIDEVSGVIVASEAVRVSTVAIQQGNLTISINESPAVSQPNALSRGGQTAVVPQSSVKVDEETGKQLIVMKSGTSLQSLVGGLNSLGVSVRDMISILQSIKALGALQAEIEVI